MECNINFKCLYLSSKALYRTVKGVVSEQVVKSCYTASEAVHLFTKLVNIDLNKTVTLSLIVNQCKFCEIHSDFTTQLSCEIHYCCNVCFQVTKNNSNFKIFKENGW